MTLLLIQRLFKSGYLAGLTLFVLLLAGCKKEEPETMIQPLGDKTVTKTALDVDRFSLLSEALKKTGLDATLDGAGPFTVFAPNNTAMAAALQSLGYANIEAIPTETLKNVLLYHVLAGKKEAAALNKSYLATQLPTSSLGISKADEKVYLNGAVRVVSADIAVTNGVIHEIDKVLLPPTNTLAALATALPTKYSTLVAALQKTNLVATLSGTTPFTVFAPTNEAFAAANINPDNYSTSEDIAELRRILLYHVVPGVNFSFDITSGLSLISQQGVDLGFSIRSDQVYINGESNALNPSFTVPVAATDLLATNGVLHEINGVLFPPLENIVASLADPNTVPFNTSTLNAQLVRTGLNVTLASGGPYTLFAPANTAFAGTDFKQFIVNKGYAADLASATPDKVPVEVMRKILQYHVINGRKFLYDLKTETVRTLAGEDLEIDGDNQTIGGVPIDGDPNYNYDFNTTNGVIHRIFDNVTSTGTILIPPSLR